MSESASIEAVVTKIKSGRAGTEVSFKNISNKAFGLLSNRFRILFDDNPGWDKGDEMKITAEKTGGQG